MFDKDSTIPASSSRTNWPCVTVVCWLLAACASEEQANATPLAASKTSALIDNISAGTAGSSALRTGPDTIGIAPPVKCFPPKGSNCDTCNGEIPLNEFVGGLVARASVSNHRTPHPSQDYMQLAPSHDGSLDRIPLATHCDHDDGVEVIDQEGCVKNDRCIYVWAATRGTGGVQPATEPIVCGKGACCWESDSSCIAMHELRCNK